MNRRDALKGLTGGSAVAAAAFGGGEAFWQMFGKPTPLEAAQAATSRGLPPVKITNIKVIISEPPGGRLCNVKVYTSEPGLVGIGDGNHAERVTVVGATLEQFVKPLVVGRSVTEIEKLWQELWVAPYWRHDVDANNAMSALDSALWDIMGKRAGMPVYELLGGKVRPGCRMYMDASGSSLQEIEDQVRAGMERGYQHVRLRRRRPAGERVRPDPFAGPNQAGGVAACEGGTDNDAAFIQDYVEQFEHLRKTIGWNIELCVEVHERPHPTGSLMIAKALEPYRPFFIEDPFAPEDVRYYEIMRQQSAVGIAMGELFVNRQEWLPLVKNRWIDYMRGHISAMGGLNIARKIAALCEFYNVRTAWHGPSNVSPVGHCVNLHLDLALYNFGIAEGRPFNDTLREMFPGLPEIRDAVRYANDQPGLGVDLDETVAAKFPLQNEASSRGARGQDCEPRRP